MEATGLSEHCGACGTTDEYGAEDFDEGIAACRHCGALLPPEHTEWFEERWGVES